MGKALVIVESPAKAKTINKYLGSDYVVKSSVGHIRDLPTSGSAAKKSADSTSTKTAKKPKKDERGALVNRMGVDPWHNWEAHYEVLPGKEKVVSELKQLAEKADHIYLATDLDREGEAIAWHLREVIGGDDARYSRVVFNEITKNAIRQAFNKPGELNIDRVNAQQARRFMDRVVGYMVSPLLWKKIARGLSAGRVQSVAVRLVVEREREIKAFVPEEFWEVDASTTTPSGEALALQVTHQNDKPFRPVNKEQTQAAVSLLEKARYSVLEREDKPTTSKPGAPFITSTLQQAASTRLGFGVKKTMMMAQRLYEAGYITYMRTDSTNLSQDAVNMVRGYISDNYHWGWIFFINVPIGVAVVLMTLQTLRGRETRTERRRIDAVGLALLVIGIGSLQIMLDRGKELDWFSSQEIIILTVVAVVAICFLIVWELTDDNPIVDLSLFKSRNFTIGCLCISLAYMLYFGAIVLLPQLLQEVYGYTATWAGLASAPVGIIPVILSPIIGRFAHKLDMRRLVTFSFIMYAVCFYWRAYTFEPGMDFGASAWPQFIQGFAVACFFMPLTTITLSGLPPERLAAASSLSNFTRTLAGSIGTSITTTMWTNRESLHHAQLTESVNPFNPNAQAMYSQLEGLGMTQQQASGWIAQQITNQGLIISANEIFWMSAGIFLVLLGLVWFAKPPFGAGGGGGGAH